MTSNTLLVCVVATALSSLGSAAHAETFQWKDSNGQTIISDTPPPATAKNRRSIGGQQPSVVSEKPVEKAADGAKTAAEKDMEFKKRQQEAKEKADKQAKEEAATAEKRENCERAKRNLTALENNQPMVTLDENGQRKVLDTTLRQQEIERAQRVIAETCQ
ncbi:MAG: DUF4124 domain-containing protein [Dechloromonas agitata]|uniref:DUF4124 domain-containing protein n=1 Tax=Dechloromonas agitata TaxID=73030 RepID=A0A930BT02_9RHOO|nr:DUF4124 domain-containing protein [Dechloromonas agitata]